MPQTASGRSWWAVSVVSAACHKKPSYSLSVVSGYYRAILTTQTVL